MIREAAVVAGFAMFAFVAAAFALWCACEVRDYYRERGERLATLAHARAMRLALARLDREEGRKP